MTDEITPSGEITKYFEDTDVQLREFAETLGPTVSWTEDELVPEVEGAATVLIMKTNDLRVEDGLRLRDKYDMSSPRRRFSLYVHDFEDEANFCAGVEKELLEQIAVMTESTKALRGLSQKLWAAVDAAADVVGDEIDGKIKAGDVPIPEALREVEKVMLSAQTLAGDVSRDLGNVRLAEKVASGISTIVHSLSLVTAFRWATTDTFVAHWVPTMNALLKTRPQHFTTDEFAHSIRMNLKRELLPVYEMDALATTEKLAAIAALHLLIVGYAKEAANVTVEKPTPRGDQLEELGMQQNAIALRVVYFALNAYRKLSLDEGDRISAVLKDVVQNVLTIQYVFVFERLANRFIKFKNTDIEPYWYWRVYEMIDWHEKIDLLQERAYGGITTAVNTAKEEAWDEEL